MSDPKPYDHDEEIKKAKDEFFGLIKDHLLENFTPVAKMKHDTTLLSTMEVYDRLQRLFPSKLYKPDDVAVFLRAAGFQFEDVGVMRYEWLLQKKAKG